MLCSMVCSTRYMTPRSILQTMFPGIPVVLGLRSRMLDPYVYVSVLAPRSFDLHYLRPSERNIWTAPYMYVQCNICLKSYKAPRCKMHGLLLQ